MTLKLVERWVAPLEPEGRPLSVSQALARGGSVVLLGDPGMGKSTVAAQVAASEPRSLLQSVRVFIHAPAAIAPDLLVLDGLDEAMSAGAADPLAQVAGRLLSLGRPRFWLTCRAVDWLGGIHPPKAALALLTNFGPEC